MTILLSEYIIEVVHSLERTNPEFSHALKKWSTFITSTVIKTQKTIGGSEEDLLQDLLMDLVQVGMNHPTPLYRYKKRNWELVERESTLLFLQTPVYLKSAQLSVWVPKNLVERVKKASLPSLLYRRIQQFSCNHVTKAFIGRNGYVKGEAQEISVITKSGYRRELIKKTVTPRIRVVDEVSFEQPLNHSKSQPSSFSPSDFMASEDDHLDVLLDLNLSIYNLSEPAQVVFGILPETDGISEVVEKTGYSRRRVDAAQVEIRQRLVKQLEIPRGVSPLYVSANYVS